MNVWQEVAHSRERRFGDGSEHDLIRGEYAGTEDWNDPCPCGGTMQFRATIGVLMCPDCRQMAHQNGDLIGKGSGRTPELEA